MDRGGNIINEIVNNNFLERKKNVQFGDEHENVKHEQLENP